ncbi:MAG: hypothetical protein ACYS47_05935 [Planctomycetota bacterium]|jgi:hypothetical protein
MGTSSISFVFDYPLNDGNGPILREMSEFSPAAAQRNGKDFGISQIHTRYRRASRETTDFADFADCEIRNAQALFPNIRVIGVICGSS